VYLISIIIDLILIIDYEIEILLATYIIYNLISIIIDLISIIDHEIEFYLCI
jgi:hypothetical protein